MMHGGSKDRLPKYAYGLAAMLVPAAMQFGLFAFFARTLGAEQYGLYVALLSWGPICFELVGWGAGEYLIKRAAQDKGAFKSVRSHMRAVLWLSLPPAVFCFAIIVLGIAGLAVDLPTLLLLGFAEFAGMRMMVNAEQVSIAQGRFGMANWVRSAQVLPRVAGVMVTFFALRQQTFEAFALGGSLGMLLGGLAASSAVGPKADQGWQLSLYGLRQGTWFTGTQLVRAAQGNIDRIVLAAVLDPLTLGLYGAAQRFMQLGQLPVQAVLRIKYPGFFKAGVGGFAAAVNYGWSVLPLTLVAAFAAAAALAMAAKLLPWVIGPEFEQSANYLLYLAPVIPLFAINSVLSDILSGAGYLLLRLVLSGAGVVLQGLMFWFLHEGNQIVLASYAGISLSCALTAATTLVLLRSDRRSTLAPA